MELAVGEMLPSLPKCRVDRNAGSASCLYDQPLGIEYEVGYSMDSLIPLSNHVRTIHHILPAAWSWKGKLREDLGCFGVWWIPSGEEPLLNTRLCMGRHPDPDPLWTGAGPAPGQADTLKDGPEPRDWHEGGWGLTR